MDRRLGRFYASIKTVKSRKILDVLISMKFVPTRVECLFYRQQFEYIGTSPLFDIVEFGQEIPTYDIIVNDLDDNNISVSVNKIV